AKGGIGKSFVNAMIAQYGLEKELPVKCLDIDPGNKTLAHLKALNAVELDIMENNSINQGKFDEMMEIVFDTPENGHVILDPGASAFIEFTAYMVENQVFQMLDEMGHQVFIHVVIAGGADMMTTLQGFKQMAAQFPETVNFYVWLNEYHGDIKADGKGFEQMNVYKTFKDRIQGIIVLPKRKAETFGLDIEQMMKAGLTFSQAIESEDFKLMQKQRLKMMKQSFFESIGAVVF
uniref:conjugal transfer protein TraL n=1 Tax=Kistimonas asteriae TaxID=517724 RepID=UPI001BAA0617